MVSSGREKSSLKSPEHVSSCSPIEKSYIYLSDHGWGFIHQHLPFTVEGLDQYTAAQIQGLCLIRPIPIHISQLVTHEVGSEAEEGDAI